MSIFLEIRFEGKSYLFKDYLEYNLSTTSHSRKDIYNQVKQERSLSSEQKSTFEEKWILPKQSKRATNDFAIRGAFALPWNKKKQFKIGERTILLNPCSFPILNKWEILSIPSENSLQDQTLQFAGRALFSVEAVLWFLPSSLCSLIVEFYDVEQEIGKTVFRFLGVYCASTNLGWEYYHFSNNRIVWIFLDSFHLSYLKERIQIYRLSLQGDFFPVTIKKVEGALSFHSMEINNLKYETLFFYSTQLILEDEDKRKKEKIPFHELLFLEKKEKTQVTFPTCKVLKGYRIIFFDEVAGCCSFLESGLQPDFELDKRIYKAKEFTPIVTMNTAFPGSDSDSD